MAFGVFIHRPDSIYDDRPDEQYQFPPNYLSRAKPCVGDWILYYEPRKVPQSRGYFAMAKVQEIVPDPNSPPMYVARIDPGSYLEFPKSVPFSGLGGVVERGVLNDQGQISGRAQAAIRSLSSADFNRILERGFDEDVAALPRVGDSTLIPGFGEQRVGFDYEDGVRQRASYLSSRIVRDRVFRQIVLRAYDSRCAITGLKLINGGGRAEVEAAHIKPVEANGPDIVTNGLALSGTAHWMFDRGLVSVADDHEILISRKVNDIESARVLINKTGRILVPNHPSDRPQPRFFQWHRQHHNFEL